MPQLYNLQPNIDSLQIEKLIFHVAAMRQLVTKLPAPILALFSRSPGSFEYTYSFMALGSFMYVAESLNTAFSFAHIVQAS